MTRPAYDVVLATPSGDKIQTHRLGAAWETTTGIHQLQLSYYCTGDEGFVCLTKPKTKGRSAVLDILASQRLAEWKNTNKNILVYRVFSATQGKENAVWWEEHGVIVKPENADILLLLAKTLPYPSANCRLYFAPHKNADKIKMNEENPFCEESAPATEKELI